MHLRLGFVGALLTALVVVAMLWGDPQRGSQSWLADPALAAAQPSPMVSVTTLPAIPSPRPSARTSTAAPIVSAAPSPTPLIMQPTQPPGPQLPAGSYISVNGLVANPMILTLKELQKMRRTTLTLRVADPDGRHRVHFFTGVLLRDIVEAAHPNVTGGSSQSTAAFVLVEGLRGTPTIVGFPEFEQAYDGKQVLVAYYQDSRPLAAPGIAQLIVPGDNSAGRFVSGITSITIGEPPR
jgi:DMSO/TMAO reductase YedYZ molybdopterin-dependent catalytic subunit